MVELIAEQVQEYEAIIARLHAKYITEAQVSVHARNVARDLFELAFDGSAATDEEDREGYIKTVPWLDEG